jgi:hypothetical protein
VQVSYPRQRPGIDPGRILAWLVLGAIGSVVLCCGGIFLLGTVLPVAVSP